MMVSSLLLSWLFRNVYERIKKKELDAIDVLDISILRAQFMPLITAFGVALRNNWMLYREREADQVAVKTYASRWLGVWSEDDEAFAGLKGTFAPHIQVMPRLKANIAARSSRR